MPVRADAGAPAALRSEVARPRHCEIAEPWHRPWWWCARGDRATFGWIVLLHASILVAPFVTAWPPLWVVATSLLLTMLGGLGTTVAYHRSLAHGAVRLHPLVEQPLILLAMLNGSGTPLSWVANHRLHHATSDSEEDISSPAQGGFWWAHLRWLWQAGQAPPERYCASLARQPRYRIWSRLQVPLLAVSFFGPLLISPAWWFWLGPARLLLTLHLQCTINSICHLGDARGQGGSSRNVAWLAPLHFFEGENWHRNHHDDPANARIGRRPGELDVGWWTIVALRAFRLASVRGGARGAGS